MSLKEKVINKIDYLYSKQPDFVDNTQKEDVLNIVHSLRKDFSEDNFILLLSILYITQKVNYRIKEATINGNKAFCDSDDLFSEFVRITYEAIFAFDDNIGSFISYVGMVLRNFIAETNKNSYFKVTGNIAANDPRRNQRKVISFDTFEDQLGFYVPLDKTTLNQEILDCINDLPEFQREIVEYKFFSEEGKHKNNIEIAQHFGIKEERLKYLLRLIKQRLYQMGICDSNTLLAEYAEDSEYTYYKNLDLNKSYSDEYVGSYNYWLSNYECYA